MVAIVYKKNEYAKAIIEHINDVNDIELKINWKYDSSHNHDALSFAKRKNLDDIVNLIENKFYN